jgi:serine/threonine protein kinase/WD40 repeat protein
MARVRAPPPILDGRYRVDRLVGRGGYGAVYAGHHLSLDAPVAIKMLQIDAPLREEKRAELVAAFLDEGRLLTRLRHPNIVAALDLGVLAPDEEEGAAPYLVMEWVHGETLERVLAARDAPFSLAEAWALFEPLCDAMACAHAARIAHRDLKPANVMIARDAVGRVVPRVIDFGIAKLFEDEDEAGSGATRTAARSTAFTPAYAAPEQIAHARTGPWTDVHALGLLFVELLTRARPYGEGDEARLAAVDPRRPTLSAKGIRAGAFGKVIAKAVSLRPNERYRNAGELLEAAREAARAMGLAAGTTPPPRAEGEPEAEKSASRPPPRDEGTERTERTEASTIDGATTQQHARAGSGRARRRGLFAGAAAVAIVAVMSGGLSLRARLRAPEVRAAPSASASPPARKLELRALTHGARVENVEFSPDGRALAFGDGSVVRIHHDDGSPETVVPGNDGARCTPLSWDPGGKALVIGGVARDLEGKRGRLFTGKVGFSSDGKRRVEWSIAGSVRVYDAATDALVRSVKRPEGTVWLLRAEPAPRDGRVLLATAHAGEERLWLVAEDGAPREIARAGRILAPRWSPRGDAVYALSSDAGAPLDLVKIPLDGGAPRVLASAVAPWAECGSLSISPDGKRAAFVREQARAQLFFLRRDGARFEPRALSAADARLAGLSASPDRRSVAYVELGSVQGGYVQTLDLATAKLRPIGFYTGTDGPSTAWAPDGKRIALASPRGGRGMVVTILPVDRGLADGREVRCDRMSAEVSYVEWLDDRTLLYEGLGNTSVRALDLVSGTTRDFVAPDDGWVFLVRTSPDRRRLLLHWNRAKGPAGTYKMTLVGGAFEHVPDTGGVSPITWDGDDRIVVQPMDKLHRTLLVAERGELKSLGEVPVEGPLNELTAVEGGFVAIVDRTTSDAWIAEGFDPDVPP